MKVLKIIYYRIKFKEANFYSQYWAEKVKTANPKDIEKWSAYMDHMVYWWSKMLDYCIARNKELES